MVLELEEGAHQAHKRFLRLHLPTDVLQELHGTLSEEDVLSAHLSHWVLDSFNALALGRSLKGEARMCALSAMRARLRRHLAIGEVRALAVHSWSSLHSSCLDEEHGLRAIGGLLNARSLSEALWVGVGVKNRLESEMESSRI